MPILDIGVFELVVLKVSNIPNFGIGWGANNYEIAVNLATKKGDI